MTLHSLVTIAAGASLLALAAAWGRRVGARESFRDAVAATVGASLPVAGATTLYALTGWRGAASILFVAGSLAATLALRGRGRRSVPRALAVSGLGAVLVLLWLTLNLRGPRGGWQPAETSAVVGLALLTLGAGACAGWWSKPVRR